MIKQTIDENLYFVLAGDCKVVRGLKRCLLIDFGRSDLYFFSHEYVNLLESMQRQQLSTVIQNLEDEASKIYFNDFISILETNELGIFTDSPDLYPEISEELVDDYIFVKDVIIELDIRYFDHSAFEKLCIELDILHCKDFQLRLLSDFDLPFVEKVINTIEENTNAHYVELHCSHDSVMDDDFLYQVVEKNKLLSQLFIYNAPDTKKFNVEILDDTYFPVTLGRVFEVTYPFDDGKCCGQINERTLDFSSFFTHNLLKARNGCLDRKVTIDRYGQIKNCPSLKQTYGDVKEVSIKSVIDSSEFRKYWFITKDNIKICNVCEFRYNCTDCRAFLTVSDDLFSKPLKCGYNPDTCTWDNQTN